MSHPDSKDQPHNRFHVTGEAANGAVSFSGDKEAEAEQIRAEIPDSHRHGPAELAAEIVEHQRIRLTSGTLPSAERYFELWPDLFAQREHALDVICNEFLLLHGEQFNRNHSEASESVVEDYLRRFPEHRTALERQFQYYRMMDFHDGLWSSVGECAPDEAIAPIRESEVIARRFEVRSQIGAGANSNVYKGWDRQLKRFVAIKISRAGIKPDSRYFRRFAREAESTARLQHPGIIEVYEFGIHDGNRPFIVGQLLIRGTLQERLDDAGRTPQQSARWVTEICNAVEYAHQQGVIHRDIKPANILVKEDGGLCITDFGLAAISEAEQTLTRQGDMLGTPAYMSPEQSRGQKDVGPATDIYSIGVVLYHLICGRLPFTGSSAAIIHQTIHDDPLAPGKLDQSIPLDLETICLKALAKRPRSRYQSAAEMSADLQRFLNHEPIRARRIGIAGRFAMWARRNPALCATIAAFTTLLVVILITGFNRLADERDRLRIQRDTANRNLLESLVSNAETSIRSKGVGWYESAFTSLQEAALLEVPDKDKSKLRELLIELLADTTPRFVLESETLVSGTDEKAAITAISDTNESGVCLVGFSDGSIVAIDGSDQRLGRLKGPVAPIREIQICPGRHLVAALSGERLWIWNIEVLDAYSIENNVEAVIEGEARASVSSFAWSTDGTRIAVASLHGSVVVHEVVEDEAGNSVVESSRLLEVETNGKPVSCISFGREQIVAGFDDSALGSWDAASGELIDLYTKNADPIVSVGIASGVVCWTDKVSYRIGVWDAGNGSRFSTHLPGAVVKVAALRGSAVYADEAGTLCLASPQTIDHSYSMIATSKGVGEVAAFGVDEAGYSVIVGSPDGTIRRWALSTSDIAVRQKLRHGLARGSDDEFITPVASLGTTGFPAVESSAFPDEHTTLLQVSALTGELVAANTQGVAVLDPESGEVRHFVGSPLRRAPVAMAVSPDSSAFALIDEHGAIGLFDLETFEDRGTFELPLGTARGVLLSNSCLVVSGTEGVYKWDLAHGSEHAVCISKQSDAGKHLFTMHDDVMAIGGAESNVELRNVNSGDLIKELADSTGMTQLEFSADGQQLIGLNEAPAIMVWDAATGVAIRSFFLEPNVVGFTLDPLGRFLIGEIDQFNGAASPELFDLSDGSRIGAFEKVYTFGPSTFASDGEHLWFTIRGGLLQFDRAELTDALERFESGRDAGLRTRIPFSYEFALTTGHVFDVWSVVVSPDRKRIATTGFDRRVIVRDADTFEVEELLTAHRDDVWGCAFSPDGSLLATGSELEGRGEVILWNVADWEIEKRIFFGSRLISSLSFHPDAPLLAISSFDGSACIVDYETGRIVQELVPSGSSRTMEIMFSPDGQHLAAARTSRGISIWAIDAARDVPGTGEVVVADEGERVWTVQFSKDGRQLFSGTESGLIRIYEFPSSELLVTLRTSTNSIRKIAVHPENRFLAFTAYSNTGGQIWDLASLRQRLAEAGLDW
ncbi:MAG: WD40 repeat domain-containing serine/threonine-protein kinase [Planctomycetota bacterium]